MATVAIVEDDRTLASIVAKYVERAGHEALQAHDGVRGLELVTERRPDLLLLDVMLPELSGIEVCRRVRQTRPGLPVIMLTALGEVLDRIAGLEVGADDYVTKPFSPRELMLRVESVLRRASREPDRPTVIEIAGLRVDAEARRAHRDDVELALTIREFDLLAFLVSHPGVAYRREQLMREVWGWTFGDQSTVTVHIRRLREKLEADPAHPTLIQTVWGVGYRFEPPSVEHTGS